MRRIKASVITDGKDYHAFTPGSAQESFNGLTVVDGGYILVPLKKATSRQKGNGLELEVAKVFSKWLYNDEKVLTRTPLSGGWNGSKMGDISADPVRLMEMKLQLPKLYVECKNRDGLLSEEFFNWMSSGSPKRLTEWIEDTKKKAGKQVWFIVLKGRGTEPWVLTTHDPNQLACGGFVFDHETVRYDMFPLKLLGSLYTYSPLKQQITLGA